MYAHIAHSQAGLECKHCGADVIRGAGVTVSAVLDYAGKMLKFEAGDRDRIARAPFLVRCLNCAQEAVFYVDNFHRTFEVESVEPQIRDGVYAPALGEMDYFDYARLVRGLVANVLPKAQRQDVLDDNPVYYWIHGKRQAQLAREEKAERTSAILFRELVKERGGVNPAYVDLNLESARAVGDMILEWLCFDEKKGG